MRTFLIERHVPGLGQLDGDTLAGIAARSNDVITAMPGALRWRHSYVTGDHFYCVYDAADEAAVRAHAAAGGFPVDRIIEIAGIIDPGTAGAGSGSGA